MTYFIHDIRYRLLPLFLIITDILIRFITELLYLYFQNRWYDWIVLFRFILYQGSFSWNRNNESCLRTDFIHNMLLVLVIFFRLKTERPSTLYILNNEDLLMIKSNTWKWLQTHEEIFLYGWLTWCTKVELIVSNSIITYQRGKNLPKQLKRYEGIFTCTC